MNAVTEAPDTARARRSGASLEERLGRRALFLIAVVLIVLTLVSYRHVTRNGFVFDDGFYLVDNQHVQQGITADSVRWAFTAFYGANWQPLTWLSSMLDYALFGANPVGHHATNLIFHLASTVLLLVVLARITGSVWKSAFVAAVFALHPLHVESVAWASERKDVLSAFFMLLTVWAWVGYTDRPSVRRYALAASAFALGLMSKPMLVSLPILLLLLDYWPLRRASIAGGKLGFGRLLTEKMPLFALSLGSCVITYFAQRSGGAVIELVKFPVGLRVANAVVSYAAYIGKALWPAGLAAYYPYPRAGVPTLSLLVALVVIASISLLAVRAARSRPYLAVGWLWYIVTLIPVIGLVQVGEQSMADRYMYIPLIGLSVMIAWGVPDLSARIRPVARGLSAASVLLVLAMAPLTSAQVRHWESNYSLFRRAATVAPGSALVFSNYGIALAERGELDKAMEQYRKAIDADPYYVQSYVNLGNTLKEIGRTREALSMYQRALELAPDLKDVAVAAAALMAETGDARSAAEEYEKSLKEDPDNPVVHHNLGSIAARSGDVEKALEHYTEALRIKPDYAAAHRSLALVLRAQGRMDEAGDHLRQAVRHKPDFAEAHNDLGVFLAQQGNLDEAMSHFRDAVKYRPDYADAHCNLAVGLGSRNDLAGAIAEYEKALKADPDYIKAHTGLATAYYAAGRYADAWREVRAVEGLGVDVPPDFLNALSSKMPPP